ncbi:hypothetical protein [Fulvivirga sediminis]|uniref:Lipoprotein n=1 Tax=Fulvivirga sediminis TaxID=2803949 RepID=A0A937F640_9BACT|nr:hypothetical protein [Fulvivirga sediminis]MBL3657122.1 hypothetical protein [Fulvivirga sediminis]
MKTYIYLIISLLLFSACEANRATNKENDSNTISACSDITINDDTNGVANYEVLSATIDQAKLLLNIRHSGGCKDISYNLITNGVFRESIPVQLDVDLVFSEEDQCEALIEKQLCFNMSTLTELYKDNYQTDSGKIILQLAHSENSLVYSF